MASVAHRRAQRALQAAIRATAGVQPLRVRASILRASRPLDGDLPVKRAWERLYHEWVKEQERGAA
jgi:hypothetical protein